MYSPYSGVYHLIAAARPSICIQGITGVQGTRKFCARDFTHINLFFKTYLCHSKTVIPSVHHLLIGHSCIRAVISVIGLKAAIEMNAPSTTPRRTSAWCTAAATVRTQHIHRHHHHHRHHHRRRRNVIQCANSTLRNGLPLIKKKWKLTRKNTKKTITDQLSRYLRRYPGRFSAKWTYQPINFINRLSITSNRLDSTFTEM